MPTSSHLLIVDDDREIRDLLARFLRKHGYRVDTAADGRAMAKLLEAGRFHYASRLTAPGDPGKGERCLTRRDGSSGS